ncbi:hypothetical protein EV426DRAFT_709372 [Tirmania nivea]|nr:hypothetical protein EV426DRAFT_709372 [Tirmania nivea]
MENLLYLLPSPPPLRRSAKVTRAKAKAIGPVQSEILDLLDNPTLEKYIKDSYEILPDTRIIRRLNIVLNGKCLTVRPVPQNIIPPPALTKLYTISLEEHKEEEEDDDEEKEDEEGEKED